MVLQKAERIRILKHANCALSHYYEQEKEVGS